MFYSIDMCRPVLILGPLADCVAEKLTIDFPQAFERLLPTSMNCTQENMEEGLQNNILVDYRRRGSIYECTPVQAIRDLCDKVIIFSVFNFISFFFHLLHIHKPFYIRTNFHSKWINS